MEFKSINELRDKFFPNDKKERPVPHHFGFEKEFSKNKEQE